MFATLPMLLVEEWHSVKNGTKKSSDYSAGSNQKVWWECQSGHEWEARVNKRAHGQNCPVCSGRKVVAGVNDLATIYPSIAAEWHPAKNSELKPNQYTSGSKHKAWWQCNQGHEWQAVIHSRTNRFRSKGHDVCPGCVGRQIAVGVNDLGTTHSDLALQWHPTKNEDRTPQQYSHGSRLKAWWKCDLGHEWQAIISSRTGGNNCPVCSNKVIVSGENNFSILYPKLVNQWHPTKNADQIAEQYSYGSKKKIWWQCHQGHEWQAIIADRTRGIGCPYCSGNLGIVGVNDIFVTHTTLANEIHKTKNSSEVLTGLKSGSGKKIWWQCEKGHEWQAVVASRTSGNNCPQCGAGMHSSRAEKELAEFLASLGVEVQTSVRGKMSGNAEIDIYLPQQRIGIEFNGIYWHSEKFAPKNYHQNKYLEAKRQGITLYQIWEDQWLEKQELVKIILAHKIGISSQIIIGARKTHLTEISNKDANTFFDKNHIQGSASGSFAIGLKDVEGNLVAVMSFKRTTRGSFKELELVRYATSARIVGGFSKILFHVEKTYQPEKIVSFSDNCISNGSVYRTNGFFKEKVLRPDYMYVVGKSRKHKFGYRLKKFETDPALEFQPNMTEKQLAALNGLERIWDAGKIRWVKQYAAKPLRAENE